MSAPTDVMEWPSSRRKLSELEVVYNPALGAYLLWRTATGHFAETSTALPLPLAFLILPIALHEQTREAAARTQPSSGLTVFAAKFGEQQEDLLAIHHRAVVLRELTLASIAAGTLVGLLRVHAIDAQLLAHDKKPSTPDPALVRLGAVCEKLGRWFARLPIEQVASTLRVAF